MSTRTAPAPAAAPTLHELTPCLFHALCERWINPTAGPLCPPCADEHGEALHPATTTAPAPGPLVLAQVRPAAGGPVTEEFGGRICWLCSRRRKCTSQKFGWECRACRELADRPAVH